MDDEAAFGKRLHTLPFGEAIERGLLTDYRVVIVGVDDETIASWINDRRIVGTDTGIETDAESLAAEIGLLKAIKDYSLQRLITFHSRVKRAEQFSDELLEVSAWAPEARVSDRSMWCEHVSGEMPTFARTQKLRKLKAVGKKEIGLLSNARCLSEGVDVPALDGVAFIDAKKSQLDIVQAVGRAIRLSDDKTMGTIVIPVFIQEDEDAEKAIEASNFKPVWDVLDALKAHDDVLSDQLDQLRIELGAKRKSKVGESDLTKIVFDLPTSVDASFADSLRAQLVEKTTESWMFWYGLLETYVKEHGHCMVPHTFLTAEGFKLGRWVITLRTKKETLLPERKARLDSLGFVWDARFEKWEEGFSHLEAFVAEHGHGRVPDKHESADGFKIGIWASTQRQSQITGKLSSDRKARLDALGFVWNALDAQWEENFAHLETYKKEHGHCRVPRGYRTCSGFKLDMWVVAQRSRKENLLGDRLKRLDALGFVWDPHYGDWEEGFARLAAFVEEHGHCRVPQDYTTADGFRLGQWVSNRRAQQKNGRLSSERKAKLDALGFVWNARDAEWEEGFARLAAFVKEHGHCRVPQGYKTGDGYRLGQWVSKHRQPKGNVQPDRKLRLNALGFEWDPLTTQWEEGFARLAAFVKEHGHCRVSGSYKTADGKRLGGWVSVQRSRKDKLSPDRKKRLDALGFVWSAKRD